MIDPTGHRVDYNPGEPGDRQPALYEIAPYGAVGQLLEGTSDRFCLIRDDLTVIEELTLSEARLFAAASDLYEFAAYIATLPDDIPALDWLSLREQAAVLATNVDQRGAHS